MELKRIIVAMDSFKGSLSSMEAGEAVALGVRKACDAEVCVLPLADGGEGTMEALRYGLGGRVRRISATGPLGDALSASYVVLPETGTAVIEMAAAAGLDKLTGRELQPRRATTRGVGELILDAIRSGCRELIIGIGGSATIDCGAGMLSAMGVRFLDASGRELEPVLESFGKIARIDTEAFDELTAGCRFRIACDVTNPLCGPRGAIRIFGAQKGVKPEEMEELDNTLSRFAKIVSDVKHTDYAGEQGAGAAGGLGFAFLSFFPEAVLESGISIVFDVIGIKSAAEDADLLITGEGRLDGQSVFGKAPMGIGGLAREVGCKAIALAGSLGEGAQQVNDCGIDGVFSIVPGPCSLEEAMSPERAKQNLSATAEQVIRLIR